MSDPQTDLERAVAILRGGGLVALPTETVYGLAVDAANEVAVRRMFAVKGRPASHPVIVHLAEPDQLAAWARVVPPVALKLAEAYWPGPLTIVLPRSAKALDVVTGGQDTVALRVPDHALALEVLRAFGGGLAAPSANRFGHVSPTTADHVREDLGAEVDLVLDGGPCRVGVESTIVDLASDPERPRVMRRGAVLASDIATLLGVPVGIAIAEPDPSTPPEEMRVPGSHEAHYAPRAGVELVSAAEAAGRAEALSGPPSRRVVLIAPESVAAPALSLEQRLNAPTDPAEFARALYALLRNADALAADVALVVPPPESGLGEAVRDRLRRAARGRRKP
ncbi:MAG: L-threonylcarbamoyladenylate synthase [Candidatus Eisenbacteria bacterium]